MVVVNPVTALAGLRRAMHGGALAGALTPLLGDIHRVDWLRLVDTDRGFSAEVNAGTQAGPRLVTLEFVDEDVEERAAMVRRRLAKPSRAQLVDPDQVIASRDLSMVASQAGLDVRLMGLDLFHDPDRRTEMLGDLVGEPSTTQLLAHRLGKRAVFRVTGPGGSVIVKVVKHRSPLNDQVKNLAALLDGRVSVPRIIRSFPERNALVWEDLGAARLDLDDPAVTRRVARLTRALHESSIIGVGIHSVRDECQVIERHTNLASAVRPESEDAIRRLGADALAVLTGMPSTMPRLVHRDLHPGQVASRGSDMVLIDLDTVTMGDPAMDVGNLAAHLGGDTAERLVEEYASERAVVERVVGWRRVSTRRLELQSLALGLSTESP